MAQISVEITRLPGSVPGGNQQVFFYQSPSGGRVFFDELGPPWPKHPCTDRPQAHRKPAPTHVRTGSVLDGLVFGPVTTPKTAPGWRPAAPHDWRPLVAQTGRPPEVTARHVRFHVAFERVPGNRFYLPQGWPGDAPVYWRWSPDRPGMVELSSIRFGEALTPAPVSVIIPGWIRNDAEFEAWLKDPNAPATAEQLNALGWAFSFAWRLKNFRNWEKLLASVDLELARSFFEAAAAEGFWAAVNNLGTMARDGLGAEPDPERAFACYFEAAKSGQPVPMRHLARCYREGIGCPRDHNMAVVIETMIVDIERAQAR